MLSLGAQENLGSRYNEDSFQMIFDGLKGVKFTK